MTDLSERHAYALANPLNTASGNASTVIPFREVATQADGNLLVSVLAVDR